jgi:ParB family chromosome partitioning protein
MPKRGGLGQRGLDLLIPNSPRQEKKPEPHELVEEHAKKEETLEPNDLKESYRKEGIPDTVIDEEMTDTSSLDSSVSQNQSSTDERIENTSRDTENLSTDTDMKVDVSDKPLNVDIHLVEPNHTQPRKVFNEDSLQELSDSIKNYGIIQPLIVQKKDDYYEIIAGERRWRAAKLAGLKEIPVLVKEYSDEQLMEISLIENIQREDLNPIEEANAFRRLMDEYNLKQDELAEKVSKSRAAIANSVRLLKLDPRVQNMLVDQMLSTGHARALLAIEDQELQFQTAQRIFDEKMSVRDVEKLVKRLLKQPSQTEEKTKDQQISEALISIYKDMEEQMKSAIGTKVTIAHKTAEKGRVEIDYYSKDDLERIYEVLRNSGTISQ